MNSAKYNIGDLIEYRGCFGNGPVEQVNIHGMGRKNERDVYDLSNGHWCYEYQIIGKITPNNEEKTMKNNVIQLTSVPVKIQAMDMDHGHPVKTTEKYRHVNTRDVVNKFESRGWTIAKYNESRTVKYAGYQTHVVQLSNNTSPIKVGDSELRIVILNDHRGSKSLTLKLGVFRLVCSNGLIVSDTEFESVRLRHIGDNLDVKVDEFIEKIAAAAEYLSAKVAEYSARQLTADERFMLARGMLEARYPGKPIDSDMIESVLDARRFADMSQDLWTVFNRIQENIVRGTRGVRRITSVKRDVELNEKLWDVLKAA